MANSNNKSPFKTTALGNTEEGGFDFQFPTVGTVAKVSRDVLLTAAAATALYRMVKNEKAGKPEA